MRHRITRCALLGMLLSSCSPKIEPKAEAPDGREVQALKELDQAKEKFQSGDYETARLVLTHAETLAESAHSTILLLNIDMWLGSVQMRQSHFEDALQYFEQLLPPIGPDDRTGPEDRTLRAKVLNNAAVCNYRLGELDTALNYYKRALAIDIETHDVAEQSICLGNMGNIYLDRGEYLKANQHFTEAARLNPHDEDNLARW
ncbi:MAG: tetratricopeptide repeat protein, partial [Acidobacteriota bacterium]|nr:tetratricopeptide repeat protein [Acidobacteriota bacterium]